MTLPKKVIRYIAAVVLLSILVLSFLIYQYDIPDIKKLVFWTAISILTESLSVMLPSGIGISVGFAISLASIIIGGPLLAAIVSALGFMLRILRTKNNEYLHIFNTPIYKTIFNGSLGIIAAGVSGIIYTVSGGQTEKFSIEHTLVVVPVYILLNSALMVKLMSLLNYKSFTSMWINSIRGTLPSSLAVATVGIIVALAYLSYGPTAVLLFFGPLMLARFSFRMYVDMRNTYIETIEAFNKSLEAKDPYTSGHAVRVREYAVKLAEAAGLPDSKIQNIKTAALLHDIGKIGIDDNILRKPLKLTDDEYKKIQQHPIIGAEILKDVNFLKEISEIIRHHHERYDGKGYPDRLAGDEIRIEASILAIADAYDAITSNRSYRKSLDKNDALSEIKANAGTQFHPELAEKFIRAMSTNR